MGDFLINDWRKTMMKSVIIFSVYFTSLLLSVGTFGMMFGLL
jgi:hypothetical protein